MRHLLIYYYSVSNAKATKLIEGNSVRPSINHGGGIIYYSLSNHPANDKISINSSTGVISWSNLTNEITYNITVTASNSVGNTQTIYILYPGGYFDNLITRTYSGGTNFGPAIKNGAFLTDFIVATITNLPNIGVTWSFGTITKTVFITGNTLIISNSE